MDLSNLDQLEFYIRSTLNKRYSRVIVTGLDRAGKSTFVSRLFADYPTLKSGSESSTTMDMSKLNLYYSIYDRHSYIEWYVYREFNGVIPGADYESLKESYIRLYKRELSNSLIILFLDPKYRHMRSDEFDYNEYDELYSSRYLEIIKSFLDADPNSTAFILGKNKFQVIGKYQKECVMELNERKMKVIEIANLYYNGKDTGITDLEYDTLLEGVKSEDKDFNIFNYVSMEVQGERFVHPIEFTSLPKNKVWMGDDLSSQVDSCYVIPKYDGSSIRAYYNDLTGQLVSIVTRSDEYAGIIQTEKLRNKVPQIVKTGIKAVDFEACTSVEDFGEGCRSKANGLINSKYLQDEVDEKLILIPFEVITTDPVEDYKERMNLIFSDEDLYFFKKEQLTSIKDSTVLYKGKHYPIDGFVMRSIVSNWIAKYYYLDAKVTKINWVEWNRSGYGFYIPKLNLEGVQIGNSWVKNAAAGSVDTIMNNGYAVGAEVEVILSGATIPKVTRLIKEAPKDENGNYNYTISSCWDCGSELKYSSKGYYCSNTSCKYYRTEVMNHFLNYVMTSGDHAVLGTMDRSNYDGFFQFCTAEPEFGSALKMKMESLISNDSLPKLFKQMLGISRQSKKFEDNYLASIKDPKDLTEIKKSFESHMSGGAWVEYSMKLDSTIKFLTMLNDYLKDSYGLELMN